MWRVEREGGGLTEGCLVPVDDLQSHVEHFGEEALKELRGDVDTFLQYWPPQSQQFSMQYISRIFGVVRFLPKWPWGWAGAWDCPTKDLPDAARSVWKGRPSEVLDGGKRPHVTNFYPVLFLVFLYSEVTPAVAEVSTPSVNYSLALSGRF